MSIPTVNWDPSRYSVLDIVKALFMVLEDLVEDEEAQVTGINLLVDQEGMGTQHVMQMGPNIAKKVTSIFQVSVYRSFMVETMGQLPT